MEFYVWNYVQIFLNEIQLFNVERMCPYVG